MRLRPVPGNLRQSVLCLAGLLSNTACKTAGPPAPVAPGPVAGPVAAPAVDRAGNAGSAGPPAANPPSPLRETPAVAQFSAWLAAFNSADRGALVAFHQQYFPYQVASDVVGSIDRELRLRKGTGGFEPAKREEASELRVVVLLKARNAPGFARAVMEVETAAPHRVARLDLEKIATPDEFLAPDERAGGQLDAARRRRLIDGIARALRAQYVFPEVAERMIGALDDAAARGAFDSIDRGPAFVAAVSRVLHEVSHDSHLRFEFGRKPRIRSGEAPLAEQMKWARDKDFGLGTVERLQGNVARVEIFAFLPPELAGDAIAEAMTRVADADALIVDLRENHGGTPAAVALVASYLFDPTPVHLNDMFKRDTGATIESWTLPQVRGTRFGGGKPVFVTTSKGTFSGGEELAYDLTCLRRAVIVGETTGGGANPTGPPNELDDWFRIFVPWGRPINPITKTNWEGVGVTPDVAVPASAALEEAHRRALQEIARRKGAGSRS